MIRETPPDNKTKIIHKSIEMVLYFLILKLGKNTNVGCMGKCLKTRQNYTNFGANVIYGKTPSKDTAAAGIAWQYFDERAYISAGALRPGENAYARNKFNQEVS